MAKKKTSTSKKGSSSKKKTPTRSTLPASTPSSSKSSSKSASKYPSGELRLIFLIAAAAVLIISYYFNSFGLIGRLLKGIGRTLLGSMCYAIPVIFSAVTVHIFVKGKIAPHKYRYVFLCLSVMSAAALHTLYFVSTYPNFSSSSKQGAIDIILKSIELYKSGGLIGAIVALPLKTLVDTAGTCVILITLMLASFVIATGKQPFLKLAKFISTLVANHIAKKDDEDDSSSEEIKISGVDEPEKKKKKKKKDAPLLLDDKEKKKKKKKEEDEETKVTPVPSEFKINLYSDKKDETAKAGKTEIPDEIKKMALEESGGIEEEKSDTTPIEVTEEEIETDYIEYTFPPIDLLAKAKAPSGGQDRPEDLRTQAKKLVDTLASFGVEAKVLEVSKGPSVTRFELQPSAGVKVSKIVNLADDIALNLAAFGVRIEAPIPGKAAVGIEIPNKSTSMVPLRDVIDCDEFRKFGSKTAFAMGKDISGQPIVSDISKMPHMLIAGATGSGKSVCINSLITSILYKADPNEVKLILIDPKVVELGVYNGIPHLLIPVVTDPRRAAGALNWAVQEMVKRYSMFATANVRDIKGYNEYAALSGDRQLEQIVIVIDELADLMMVSPHEVEDSICRLAQMARAAGMHLVIATQRPSVDVITGLIKANVPSRIAFSVSSQIDSRTILDMGGAEKLLGKGDMLFLPMGASKPKRIQGAFVSDKEIEKIVDFIKSDSSAHYNEDIIEHIENGVEDHSAGDDSDADDLLPQAIGIVVELGQASASLLQRKLKVGYSRAGRLIDQLEERGIIGPHEGSKPRKVLISRTEYQEMMVNNIED